MTVRVCYIDPPDDQCLEQLYAQLPPTIQLKPVRPNTPTDDCEILIAGRLCHEDLLRTPSLHTLIIPYSGLPPAIRSLLCEYRPIAVHSLHYNSGPTAEMAITLLLAVMKNIVPADRELRKQHWMMKMPLRLFQGATALILGYGTVGRQVATLCSALGMHVIAIHRHIDAAQGGAETTHPPHEIHGLCDLHDLLPRADAILICLPLTPETEGLIKAEQIDLLQSTAVLINVGRAHIVDEQALYHALANRTLFGAAMDVWYSEYTEPMKGSGSPQVQPAHYPFHLLDNVIMSPHRAFRGKDAETVRMRALAQMLTTVANGEPAPHAVDVRAGY